MKRATERSLHRRGSRLEEFGGILDGTVGWQDGGEHYDNTPDPQTGAVVTLVKVTLFEGYNADESGPMPQDGRAHGHRVLARVSAPMFAIPPDGAQVILAVPAQRLRAPGGPMIVAQASASPANQYGANKAKLDFGDQVDLVIKARSITLTDYADRFITLGPKYGFKLGDARADGACLKDGKWSFYVTDGDGEAVATIQLVEEGLALAHKSGAGVARVVLQDSKLMTESSEAFLKYARGYFGPAPVVGTFAAVWVSGAPAGSTSTHISP